MQISFIHSTTLHENKCKKNLSAAKTVAMVTERNQIKLHKLFKKLISFI